MEKDIVKELLETILKSLVNKPDEVRVKKTVDEMGVLLSVELGEGDAGLVIGREGKTIQAIRTVMGAIGAKNRARLNIKLEVPERLGVREKRRDWPDRGSRRPDKTGLDEIDL